MKFRIIGILALFASLSACIDNNLPYPVVQIDVLSVEGEGFTVSGNDIDIKNRVVTLQLDEKTDISNVKITDAKITEQGSSSIPLTGTFDLRAPQSFILRLYQDYEWEYRAIQQISRMFTVEGQIGETVFDLTAHTATVKVPITTDLKAIKVAQLKLGPTDITTMNPAIDQLTDFSSVRYVDIKYHNFNERWRLYVEQSNDRIAISQSDLWANTATVTAIVSEEEQATAEVEYRRKGAEVWQKTQKGEWTAGVLTSTISPNWNSATNAAGFPIYTPDPTAGFFAGQIYEFRLLVNGEQIAACEITPPAGDTIPGGEMEDSALSCFTQENKTTDFWGSGNNTFAAALCTQSSYNGMQGSFCTKLTAADPVGILAAGNLFTGTFVKDGTSGVVDFGQPYKWTARPRAMKVKYYAATLGKVDVNKHPGAPLNTGDQDKARIFVAIVDWSTRHKVTSGLSAPTGAWDPEKLTSTAEGKVIGYGTLWIESASTGGQMIDVEIPINYYDQTTKPSGQYTIAISCSTSAYGDFMVGCKSNELYVDDFRWVY